MPEILVTVLGVTTLLGLVSLLLPLAERLAIPYAVLLAGVGIAIGAVAGLAAGVFAQTPVGEVLEVFDKFQPGAATMLAIFLPPLLFEAALNIDSRHLSDEIGPILLLAVVGVVVCTFAAGFALAPISGMGLLPCIALGAIIATTDPVAVVGIFRAVGAPRRLSTLVEGESLFNDAAAIAIYTVVLGMLTRHQGGPVDGIVTFLKEFTGGFAVGFVAGQVAIRCFPLLRGNKLAEPTLTIATAYIVYSVCDHYLHFSGVVGVAAAAIAISAGGRRRLTPSSWENLVGVWEQLAFWASSLIFLFAAMQTPHQLVDLHYGWPVLLGLLAVLVVAALGARALTLYGLLPLLSFARIAEPVDAKYKLVMLWGGMRGAVSLALALAATEDPALPNDIGVLATGFVLFTLLVNAPTLRPLMRLIQLDRLSPIEAALRDRVIGISRRAVQVEIERAASEHQIEPDIANEVVGFYDAPQRAGEAVAALPEAARLRAALVAMADRERESCSDYFEGRTVSRAGAMALMANADRLRDRARTDGLAGYEAAAARITAFDRPFRWAHLLQRSFGIAGPLAQRIEDRFEVLLATRTVLQKLLPFNHEQIGLLFGKEAEDQLGELLGRRLADIERAIAALKLQYPSYARQLEVHFLTRTAARVESERYAQLHAESVVSREVFDELDRDLQYRRRTLEVRPALDLGLDRDALIGRVPMFSALDAAARASVARLLRPRLAFPGEKIMRKGERGDAMYFISSGAVEARVAPVPVALGSGNFFGEIALIEETPRTADVVALGYCRLLTLAKRDFDRLFQSEPQIADHIRAVARARHHAAEAG